jgi:hypothetical protein
MKKYVEMLKKQRKTSFCAQKNAEKACDRARFAAIANSVRESVGKE